MFFYKTIQNNTKFFYQGFTENGNDLTPLLLESETALTSQEIKAKYLSSKDLYLMFVEKINDKSYSFTFNSYGYKRSKNDIIDILAVKCKYLAFKSSAAYATEAESILKEYNVLTRKMYLINNIPWGLVLGLLAMAILVGFCALVVVMACANPIVIDALVPCFAILPFGIAKCAEIIYFSMKEFNKSKNVESRKFFKASYNEDISKIDASSYKIESC